MKLICTYSEPSKQISYFGLRLEVPIWAQYIATDAKGLVMISSVKPQDPKNQDTTWTVYCEYSKDIAQVGLEGLDWKTTLKAI